MSEFDYIKDGTEIYRRSFATIGAEADLSRFPPDVARVVVRMIHSCGMTDLPADVGFSDGIVRALGDPAVPGLARQHETTRSAAALDLWLPRLAGAVVALGNAPTALFRLLELIGEGAPSPEAVLGIPVGFVGAAESKRALAASSLEYLAVHGRRGGSAMTVAAVNAIASEAE